MGKTIKWDFTSRCNMRCRHCSVGTQYFSRGVCELGEAAALRVVDKLASGNVTSISFLGGEPLITGDTFFRVAAHAHSHGIQTTLVTNGLLLTEAAIRHILETGINTVVVSVDGSCETSYAAVRMAGAFPTVIEHLRRLTGTVRAGRVPVRVMVNTVITRGNFQEVESIYDLLGEVGVDEWNVLSLGTVGFAATNQSQLALQPDEEIDVGRRLAIKHTNAAKSRPLALSQQVAYPLVNDFLEQQYGVRLPDPQICCSAATSLGFVSPDGMLYPCDRMAREGFVGKAIDGTTVRPLSLADMAFYDIWNCDYFQRMFSLILDDKTYARYLPCRDCAYFRSRQCNPCPLYSLDGGVRITTCEIAARHLRHRHSKPTPGRQSSASSLPGAETADAPEAKARARVADLMNAVPTLRAGIRVHKEPEKTSLLNPFTLKRMTLNQVGGAVWERIDGRRSAGEIVTLLEEVGQAVAAQAGHKVDPETWRRKLEPVVGSFLDDLAAAGMIGMTQNGTSLGTSLGPPGALTLATDPV